MSQFRRATQILFLAAGVVAGMCTALAAYFARMLISPPRHRLWEVPADYGLPYEEVQFPAVDGLRLSGWFIPAEQQDAQMPAPTLVLVHGWPWNRLGTTTDSFIADIPGSSPVPLIHMASALYHAGYQLLMFDLRNHGQSAGAKPVTFGLQEANDLLGAVEYLAARTDVNPQCIGVIGFAMGANTVLYSLPRTRLIRAAILVQPASPAVYSRRYAASLLGPLGNLVLPLTEFMYRLAGGLKLTAVEPRFAANGVGNTPILYVQGNGDPWGSVENVAQMVERTPNAVEPLFVETTDRHGAYHYVIDNPGTVDAFFRQQMM